MVQSLYNAIQENNCSEQASRMSAMENSTKNASEILEKLTLSYNRQTPPLHLTPLIWNPNHLGAGAVLEADYKLAHKSAAAACSYTLQFCGYLVNCWCGFGAVGDGVGLVLTGQ